jgi:hypothetical protein
MPKGPGHRFRPFGVSTFSEKDSRRRDPIAGQQQKEKEQWY